MRTFRSFKKHATVARIVVLLIAVVLAVAAAACDGSHTYGLNISSGAGGSVTIPGEGAFTYEASTVVELKAEPDDGYEFQVWSGDTEHIANPYSAVTTITMNQDYSIIAKFETEGEPGPGGPSLP
jgi:hypothetical protein